MKTVLLTMLYLAIPAGIALLWVLPFREKKSRDPVRTAPAKLLHREIRRGADRSGRSRLGFNHVLIFQTADGEMLELYAHEEEFGALREGMDGTLTWQGRYFQELDTLH